MMLTLNNRILVPVPMEAKIPHTSKVGEITYLCWQRMVGENKSFWGNCSVALPPDSTYCTVADTKDISEEVARLIMPEANWHLPGVLQGWVIPNDTPDWKHYNTAVEALTTFLTAHSIERAIILEKI